MKGCESPDQIMPSRPGDTKLKQFKLMVKNRRQHQQTFKTTINQISFLEKEEFTNGTAKKFLKTNAAIADTEKERSFPNQSQRESALHANEGEVIKSD